MDRKAFIKNASLATLALTMGASNRPPGKNKLPKWKGFNLLDFFNPDPQINERNSSVEEHFKWMRDWGFDFVRVPIAYPSYIDIDRTKDIVPDDVYKINSAATDKIMALVAMAHRYGLHVSLNLHRAPGYCINAGFNEPYNLWKDSAAQEAFNFHWHFWASQYKETSSRKISFDLLNEPAMREDMNDQHSKSSAVPGDVYKKVAEGAYAAIKSVNSGHLVIADGNEVGNKPVMEIAHLDIGQSCRGYYPGAISHYKAPWANKNTDNLPEPRWPGKMGDTIFNKQKLEDYYKPWMDLVDKGVGVHCGECGCWKETPHEVYLAWFADVLDVLRTKSIGIALWNFVGDFGILNSGRKDVMYKDWYGYKLDAKLLSLISKH